MLLPANGIMNVATLDHLNTPADTQIQVLPWVNNEAGNSVTLSLAELTLLAVELQIPLPMPATENVFESIDLLDFPDFNDAFNALTPLIMKFFRKRRCCRRLKIATYLSATLTNSKLTCC